MTLERFKIKSQGDVLATPEEIYANLAVTQVMAIGPCCWGKGPTIEDAVARLKPNWSVMYGGKFSQSKLYLYAVTSDARVDDMGTLYASHTLLLQKASGKK